jgi:hypothetical protein
MGIPILRGIRLFGSRKKKSTSFNQPINAGEEDNWQIMEQEILASVPFLAFFFQSVLILGLKSYFFKLS